MCIKFWWKGQKMQRKSKSERRRGDIINSVDQRDEVSTARVEWMQWMKMALGPKDTWLKLFHVSANSVSITHTHSHTHTLRDGLGYIIGCQRLEFLQLFLWSPELVINWQPCCHLVVFDMDERPLNVTCSQLLANSVLATGNQSSKNNNSSNKKVHF